MDNKRLLSLDAFRGFTIAGMMLVNNPGTWSMIYPQLKHAEWNGWTFTDWIFPFFLFIVGVAMVFSFSSAKSTNEKDILKKITRRGLIIFGLGLFLNGFPFFNLSTIRIFGVLQRIAVCYFFASIIYLKTKNSKSRAIWVLALLFFYWIVMEFYPTPEIGAGIYEVGKNFASWLDSKILTGHMWSVTKTWDPEGLFSTIPAIATTLLGVLTGEFLRSTKPETEKVIWLFLAGEVLLFLGLIWNEVLPINKSLWTSSYTIFMAGWALVIFSTFYFLIDIKNYKKIFQPLVIFGLNPIAVFVLSGLIAKSIGMIKVERSDSKIISLQSFLFQNYFLPLASPINASLIFAICFMLLMFFIAWMMWKKKIFLKV